jgi:hypothetical protein
MYYEEELINGIVYYRSKPAGVWLMKIGSGSGG